MASEIECVIYIEKAFETGDCGDCKYLRHENDVNAHWCDLLESSGIELSDVTDCRLLPEDMWPEEE